MGDFLWTKTYVMIGARSFRRFHACRTVAQKHPPNYSLRFVPCKWIGAALWFRKVWQYQRLLRRGGFRAAGRSVVWSGFTALTRAAVQSARMVAQTVRSWRWDIFSESPGRRRHPRYGFVSVLKVARREKRKTAWIGPVPSPTVGLGGGGAVTGFLGRVPVLDCPHCGLAGY